MSNNEFNFDSLMSYNIYEIEAVIKFQTWVALLIAIDAKSKE